MSTTLENVNLFDKKFIGENSVVISYSKSRVK